MKSSQLEIRAANAGFSWQIYHRNNESRGGLLFPLLFAPPNILLAEEGSQGQNLPEVPRETFTYLIHPPIAKPDINVPASLE